MGYWCETFPPISLKGKWKEAYSLGAIVMIENVKYGHWQSWLTTVKAIWVKMDCTDLSPLSNISDVLNVYHKSHSPVQHSETKSLSDSLPFRWWSAPIITRKVRNENVRSDWNRTLCPFDDEWARIIHVKVGSLPFPLTDFADVFLLMWPHLYLSTLHSKSPNPFSALLRAAALKLLMKTNNTKSQWSNENAQI